MGVIELSTVLPRYEQRTYGSPPGFAWLATPPAFMLAII